MARFDALAVLREKLKARADVPYQEGVTFDEPWIKIPGSSTDGFDVTLEDSFDEWTVYYGHAHDHFAEGEAALDRVALLISDECRLLETWRGSTLQSTKTQVREDQGWRTVMTNGLLFWPFWRPKQKIVRSNQVRLKPASASE